MLKKPESSIVEFEKSLSALIIENPSRVASTDQYAGSDFEFTTLEFNNENTSMLRVTVEPVEGVSSEPSFIVTPSGSNHFAQVITIPIKPLSSHEKVSDFPEGLKTNLLRVKGQFDTNLMNNWLYNILSDISVNVISKVPDR